MPTTWDDQGTSWRSGPWTLELRGDELADLAHDGRAVLRSIRAVVRDSDWNTAGWVIADTHADERMLRLDVRSTGLGSDIRGTLVVETAADAVTVTFDAVSHGTFSTNRTGLVVLHPPQVAGAALLVTRPDLSVQQTEFPRAISAHQPVFDIAGLDWRHAGLDVDLRFAGDVFEMEDQRNWTDASFKTYSRPLSLPFPYELADGQRVMQRIDVRVTAASDAAIPAGERTPDDDEERATIVLRSDGAFPRVATSASTAPDPEPRGLPTLGGELLVELDLATPTWPAALRRAADRGLPLDVRVVVPTPDRTLLTALAQALRGVELARIAVFHPFFHVSEAAFVEVLRDALGAAGVEVAVVGGSRSHFTELNRERSRMPAGLDGTVVTVTPLFHALGTAQLEESIAMQRLVAAQTVSYAAGSPVHIGPVTLRPRFNDVATGPQPAPTRSDLAEGYGAEFTGAVDPRQGAPELAAWVVASAAALAVPGVATLAYFEEWGPRGVRDADGTPLPAFEALSALVDLAPGGLLSGESPDGLVWAVGSRRDGVDTILVANLDRAPRRVEVTVTPASGAASDRLGVDLPPHSWRRVTGSC